MNTIGQIFAFNLLRLRESMPKKPRQSDMDELLELPENTYQRWESGKLPRSDERLEELARFFCVSVGELFHDPDVCKPTPDVALQVLAEHVHTEIRPLKAPIIEKLVREPIIAATKKALNEVLKHIREHGAADIPIDVLRLIDELGIDRVRRVLQREAEVAAEIRRDYAAKKPRKHSGAE